MRYAIDRVALLLCLASCAPTAPRQAELTVGMTRADVLSVRGDPVRQSTLKKQSEPIWGPIESFWSGVPMGSTVEIWAYDTEPGEGGEARQIELYFVDDSDRVAGIGLHVEGVAYEAR